MKTFEWISVSSLAVFLVATPTSWAAPLPVNETACAASESTSTTATGAPKGRSVEVCIEELLLVQDDLIDVVAGLGSVDIHRSAIIVAAMFQVAS